MSLRFVEAPESRSTTNDPPSFTYIYKAIGEQDQATVNAYAKANLPVSVLLGTTVLYRQDVQVEPQGYEMYLCTAPYGKRDKSEGSYTFNFDTTGGTATIKAAKEHVNSYPAGGDGNPHSGSIGVTADSVEGAEIIIPALRLNVSFSHPEGEVTLPYVRTLASYTGYTNSSSFLGFDAGELLFVGATGSDGSEAPAEISYSFIASQNATGLTIGGITGIAKDGHHYAWVEFEDDTDGDGNPARPARRVHVERVYDSVDFASLFGWS